MQPAFELSEALTPQLHAAFKVWQSERVALHAALGVEDIFPSQMQRAIGCPQTPSGRLHAGCGARQPPVPPAAPVSPPVPPPFPSTPSGREERPTDHPGKHLWRPRRQTERWGKAFPPSLPQPPAPLRSPPGVRPPLTAG